MAENKTTTEEKYTCDVLIIGAGAAGLSLALKIADTSQNAWLRRGW